MKKNYRSSFFLLILLFFGINICIYGTKYVSLKGLKEISIRVKIDPHGVGDVYNITKLNEYSLNEIIKNKLADSGLDVTPKEGLPEFIFDIDITRDFFFIQIYLRENARIERNPGHSCEVITWIGKFGSYVVVEGQDNLEGPIMNLVDTFIKDYKNDNIEKR